METSKHCLACNGELQGRADKKFCDPYCKSAWHYQKRRDGMDGFYSKVDRQLKRNRSILKSFNKAGKATVRSEVLLARGFDPNFFTHYWKNQKKEVYLFVYEYGFLSRLENGYKKYVLVTWQAYMEKQRSRAGRRN